MNNSEEKSLKNINKIKWVVISEIDKICDQDKISLIEINSALLEIIDVNNKFILRQIIGEE